MCSLVSSAGGGDGVHSFTFSTGSGVSVRYFVFSAGGGVGGCSFVFSAGGGVGGRSFAFATGGGVGVRLDLSVDRRSTGTKGNSSVGSGVGVCSESWSSGSSRVSWMLR